MYDCLQSIRQRCVGSISLYLETSFSNAIVLTSHLSSLYSATDFVLCVHCRFYRHNRVGTLSIAPTAFIFVFRHRFLREHIGTAVLICPLLIVGSLLSVVIPPMIALHCFPIPRIFIFRFTTLCSFLYLDYGYSVCFLAIAFYPWRYTSEYICNTNFLCRFWYTAPCCCDIRNSPSEVSMPFRAKGQDKFTEKSSSCREYCLQ